jgi:hypothetical protein
MCCDEEVRINQEMKDAEWSMQMIYTNNSYNIFGFKSSGVCYWCVNMKRRRPQAFKFNPNCRSCRKAVGLNIVGAS